MTLYVYPKSPKHSRADTDARILESLKRCFPQALSSEPLILRTQTGKPYLSTGFPEIGVTHSDSVILVALHDAPFGIDCEDKDRRVLHRDALSRRFFSDGERAFVQSGRTEDQKRQRFLEIWVKKEAYVKYTGQGLMQMPLVDSLRLPGHFENRSDETRFIYLYYPPQPTTEKRNPDGR